MPTSKLQEYTYQLLRKELPHISIRENYRPEWLQFEDGWLEIDLYLDQLQIGIEVQGKQHYAYVPHFHKTQDGFAKQINRDNAKRILCDANNVKLLEVSDEIEAGNAIRYITGKESMEYIREQFFKREYLTMKIGKYNKQVAALKQSMKEKKQSPRVTEINKELQHIQYAICGKRGGEYEGYKKYMKSLRSKLKIERNELSQWLQIRINRLNRITTNIEGRLDEIPHKWQEFYSRYLATG